MLTPIDKDMKRTLKVELAKRDLTQTSFAMKLLLTNQHISEIFTGKSGVFSEAFTKMLEYLDLKVILVPKDKLEAVKEVLK